MMAQVKIHVATTLHARSHTYKRNIRRYDVFEAVVWDHVLGHLVRMYRLFFVHLIALQCTTGQGL